MLGNLQKPIWIHTSIKSRKGIGPTGACTSSVLVPLLCYCVCSVTFLFDDDSDVVMVTESEGIICLSALRSSWPYPLSSGVGSRGVGNVTGSVDLSDSCFPFVKCVNM